MRSRRLRRAPRAEPLEDVIADPECICHRCKRWVDGTRGGKEARVDDIEVVEVVSLALGVQYRRRGIGAETRGPACVGYARERDLLIEYREARDRGRVASERP